MSSGIHTVETGFLGTSETELLTSDPNCKPRVGGGGRRREGGRVGGLGGECTVEWVGEGGWGKVGGLGEGLCQPHRCARALESSLNLCLRLEQCQECSHPLRKKKSTFLASCLNPTVQPLANPH